MKSIRPRPTVEDFDWRKAPRELLEQHARESFVYWHTAATPKPVPTKVCSTLAELLAVARRLRTLEEINAEIADLCRRRAALPRPIDLDEASQISRRIEQLCREPSAPSEDAGEAAPAACTECALRRTVIANIYHLTLTGGDPAATVQAVRDASRPGAPAPTNGPACKRCGSIACAEDARLRAKFGDPDPFEAEDA